MNNLNLFGLIIMVIGSTLMFVFNATASNLDKAHFTKWGKYPKSDGFPNFKRRWSKLDKRIFLAYSIFFIGVILQIFGYLYD